MFEQLHLFQDAKKYSEMLQHAFKAGYTKGQEDALKHKIEEKKKPEWIPALVRYQEIPEWWRMQGEKAKLMGEVILVKNVSLEEIKRFEAEYGKDSKADFWSKRNEHGGKWYWNKEDLILYPDSMEVELYSNAKFAHNKGSKKTRK